MEIASRNEIEGFVQRTLNNLSLVGSSYNKEISFHPVAFLVCSLLGLVVFPWEQQDRFKRLFKRYKLEHLTEQGWPSWQIVLDQPRKAKEKTSNLAVLVEHLRNALGHYHVEFSNDCRVLKQVIVTFRDRPLNEPEYNWEARIAADNLLTFCQKLGSLVYNEAS